MCCNDREKRQKKQQIWFLFFFECSLYSFSLSSHPTVHLFSSVRLPVHLFVRLASWPAKDWFLISLLAHLSPQPFDSLSLSHYPSVRLIAHPSLRPSRFIPPCQFTLSNLPSSTYLSHFYPQHYKSPHFLLWWSSAIRLGTYPPHELCSSLALSSITATNG